MSIIEMTREDKTSPLDVVERMAASNNWPFERTGEDELALNVTGRWTNYQISFTWMGDLEALHLACAFDMKVPEPRLGEVQALIALINEQMWIGHFDVWMQNGVVMFRHALVLSVFALLALLPLFSILFPEIYIPLWRPASVTTAMVTVQEISSRAVHVAPTHAINWLLVIWLVGALVASTPLAAGAVAARRMARGATPVGATLRRTVEKLALRADVLVSAELECPLTCGFLRPRILLPASAEHWTPTRFKAVLAHEIAHVRRRDVAAQVAAHIVAALWWFQPLVWMMRRRLRAESEFACDAEAVRSGFRPSEYAIELVAVARAIGRDARTPSLAISMVRSCDLEERVRAVLNPTAALLGPLSKIALVCALGSVTIAASTVNLGSDQAFSKQGGSTMKHTFLAALLTSAGLSAATITGSVSDSNGAALSNVNVLLTNPDTGAKQEAVTGADGKFSLEGDGAGQYILRLEKPGFVSIFREFDVKGDTKMDREFTMAAEGGQPVADKVVSTTEGQPKSVRVGGQVAEVT